MVTHGCYSDYTVDGIFSSHKLAKEYCDRKTAAAQNCYCGSDTDIVETILDQESAAIEYTRYSVGMMLDDGSLKEGPHEQQIFDVPKLDVSTCKPPCYDYRPIVRARSHKSAKHAMKLAVEARQEWLRNNKGEK